MFSAVLGFLSSFCPWSVCLRLTLATSISRSFAHGLQWVQPNKWDQKGEGRNVNEKGCLPYQQTKHAVPSSHQPLPTLISALRRNISVAGVENSNPLQYSSWKIPWREERVGLQFMESHRVGYDWECMTDPTDSGILGPQTLAHSCESTKFQPLDCQGILVTS